MKQYGLFSAYVVNNEDPDKLGRIQVHVPEVYGALEDLTTLPWARMLIPIFGGGCYDTQKERMAEGEIKEAHISNGVIAIPPIGTTGFVQFEQGDPQFPVWMGAWNGRAGEIGSHALVDTVGGTDAAYPNIMVIKAPWGRNIFIRFVKDERLELMFDTLAISMRGGDSPGIAIRSGDAPISIQSNGTLTLQGENIDILSEVDITIRAGKFKKVRGETVVDTIGTLRLESTDETIIHAQDKGVLQAAKGGEWQARAPKTSGFERHDPTGGTSE